VQVQKLDYTLLKTMTILTI